MVMMKHSWELLEIGRYGAKLNSDNFRVDSHLFSTAGVGQGSTWFNFSLHEPPRYLLGLSTSEPSGTFFSTFSGWISMLCRCHMARDETSLADVLMAMAHGSYSHVVSIELDVYFIPWFIRVFPNLISHFWVSCPISSTNWHKIHVDLFGCSAGRCCFCGARHLFGWTSSAAWAQPMPQVLRCPGTA